MFPQFKKVDNESGIVLFIVLMTSIIIMIYSLGVLTQSMNEVNYAQQQIDQLTCDKLKQQYFWNAYSNGAMGDGTTSALIQERNYTITTLSVVNATGGNIWQVNCSYDTF